MDTINNYKKLATQYNIIFNKNTNLKKEIQNLKCIMETKSKDYQKVKINYSQEIKNYASRENNYFKELELLKCMLTDERNNLKNNLGHITKPEAINERQLNCKTTINESAQISVNVDTSCQIQVEDDTMQNEELNIMVVKCKELMMDIKCVNNEKTNLVKQLNKQLNEKENIIKNYDEMRIYIENELASTKKIYEDLKIIINDNNSKCNNLTENKKYMENIIVDMEEQIKKKDTEIAQMKIDSNKLTKEINKFNSKSKKENEKLLTEMKDLNNEKNVIKIKMEAIQKDLEEYEIKNVENEHTIKYLKNVLLCEKENSDAKDSEIAKLKLEYTQRENEYRKKYENQCSDLQSNIDDLSNVNNDLEKQISDLDGNLKQKNDELTKQNSNNSNLANKIEEQNNIIKMKNNDIENLKINVACLENLSKTKDGEIAQLLYKYTKREDEIRETFEKNSNDLQCALNNINKTHNNLLIKHTKLNDKLTKMTDENENMTITIDQQKKEIQNNKTVIQCLKNKTNRNAGDVSQTKDLKLEKCEYTKLKNESRKKIENKYNETQCKLHNICKRNAEKLKFDDLNNDFKIKIEEYCCKTIKLDKKKSVMTVFEKEQQKGLSSHRLNATNLVVEKNACDNFVSKKLNQCRA